MKTYNIVTCLDKKALPSGVLGPAAWGLLAPIGNAP
jgi:hypothetical protein